MKKILSIYILLCFLITSTIGPTPIYAQPASPAGGDFRLPAPGVMVHLSPAYNPPILKGLKVYPENPFRFDFILDQGDSFVIPAKVGIQNQEQLKQEATKLIKYFLASLTIPEKDLWVNLSPYEKDRIIPNSFGLTEMGRDLLAEDYMLKQITASLIYPEDEVGKKFWKRIYEEATKKFGTTNIPVNTFNKVWIVPDKAVVYENVKAGTAYVVESKLKVMLEEDYLSMQKHGVIASEAKVPILDTRSSSHSLSTVIPAQGGIQNTSALGSQIVREIVIPQLIREVNENKNFAQLRQVYNSLILATWYKKKIKDSILSQVYSNKNKVVGVSVDGPQEGDIYQQYLKAFKQGVFNYIKENVDLAKQEPTPRKYFSGGWEATHLDFAMIAINKVPDSAMVPSSRAMMIQSKFEIASIKFRDLGRSKARNFVKANTEDNSMIAKKYLSFVMKIIGRSIPEGDSPEKYLSAAYKGLEDALRNYPETHIEFIGVAIKQIKFRIAVQRQKESGVDRRLEGRRRTLVSHLGRVSLRGEGVQIKVVRADDGGVVTKRIDPLELQRLILDHADTDSDINVLKRIYLDDDLPMIREVAEELKEEVSRINQRQIEALEKIRRMLGAMPLIEEIQESLGHVRGLRYYKAFKEKIDAIPKEDISTPERAVKYYREHYMQFQILDDGEGQKGERGFIKLSYFISVISHRDDFDRVRIRDFLTFVGSFNYYQEFKTMIDAIPQGNVSTPEAAMEYYDQHYKEFPRLYDRNKPEEKRGFIGHNYFIFVISHRDDFDKRKNQTFHRFVGSFHYYQEFRDKIDVIPEEQINTPEAALEYYRRHYNEFPRLSDRGKSEAEQRFIGCGYFVSVISNRDDFDKTKRNRFLDFIKSFEYYEEFKERIDAIPQEQINTPEAATAYYFEHYKEFPQLDDKEKPEEKRRFIGPGDFILVISHRDDFDRAKIQRFSRFISSFNYYQEFKAIIDAIPQGEIATPEAAMEYYDQHYNDFPRLDDRGKPEEKRRFIGRNYFVLVISHRADFDQIRMQEFSRFVSSFNYYQEFKAIIDTIPKGEIATPEAAMEYYEQYYIQFPHLDDREKPVDQQRFIGRSYFISVVIHRDDFDREIQNEFLRFIIGLRYYEEFKDKIDEVPLEQIKTPEAAMDYYSRHFREFPRLEDKEKPENQQRFIGRSYFMSVISRRGDFDRAKIQQFSIFGQSLQYYEEFKGKIDEIPLEQIKTPEAAMEYYSQFFREFPRLYDKKKPESQRRFIGPSYFILVIRHRDDFDKTKTQQFSRFAQVFRYYEEFKGKIDGIPQSEINTPEAAMKYYDQHYKDFPRLDDREKPESQRRYISRAYFISVITNRSGFDKTKTQQFSRFAQTLHYYEEFKDQIDAIPQKEVSTPEAAMEYYRQHYKEFPRLDDREKLEDERRFIGRGYFISVISFRNDFDKTKKEQFGRFAGSVRYYEVCESTILEGYRHLFGEKPMQEEKDFSDLYLGLASRLLRLDNPKHSISILYFADVLYAGGVISPEFYKRIGVYRTAVHYALKRQNEVMDLFRQAYETIPEHETKPFDQLRREIRIVLGRDVANNGLREHFLSLKIPKGMINPKPLARNTVKAYLPHILTFYGDEVLKSLQEGKFEGVKSKWRLITSGIKLAGADEKLDEEDALDEWIQKKREKYGDKEMPLRIPVKEFIEEYQLSIPESEVRRRLQEANVSPMVGDEAMMSLKEKGGIDLTPANMNLQTRMDSHFRGNDSVNGGDDKGIKFYLDPAILAQLQNAPGFVPVIINIQPLNNLQQFLNPDKADLRSV